MREKGITAMKTNYDASDALKKEMSKLGLVTHDPIIADGKLHRLHVQGDKAGSQNGWYVLFNDGLLAGSFGSWKTGLKRTWCAKAWRDLTLGERESFQYLMQLAAKAREIEEQKKQALARNKAAVIWKSASPAPPDHPYLVKKNVRSHGLRLNKDRLVIPLRDSNGTLHTLQFIDGEGNKRFLSGGRKRGCYFMIGDYEEIICIAEGFATAASIQESTGHPVAVAFDAGNLMPVATMLRQQLPAAKLIFCADNDANTPGNPGLTKAGQAAAVVGGCVVAPPCAGDFNDFLNGVVI